MLAKNKFFDDFPLKKTVIGNQIKLSKSFLRAGIIQLKDTLLMISNISEDSDLLFHFFETNTFRYLGATGRQGRGPGEYNGAYMVQSLRKSSDFHILDLNNRKLHFLSIDSVLYNLNYTSSRNISTLIPIDEGRLVKTSDALIKAQISDSTFLATVFPAFENRFTVVDSKMNILDYFGVFPHMETSNVSEDIFAVHYLSSFYQKGRVTINHEREKMVFTHPYLDLIEIFDYNTGENVVNIIGPDKNYPPRYEIADMGTWSQARPCNDCKKGYLSVTSSDAFIYVLYPDKLFYSKSGAYSNYICQFDWQGNPIYKYKLDRDIISIVFDEKGERLFAIDPDAENPLIFYKVSQHGEIL